MNQQSGPQIGPHAGSADESQARNGVQSVARAIAASLVPHGHVFKTDMPTRVAKLRTAMTLVHPPVAAHISRRPRALLEHAVRRRPKVRVSM